MMATWLDIADQASGTGKTSSRSAAVFVVKSEVAAEPILASPVEELPAHSKLKAAKKILSAAASHVSSWVKRSSSTMHPQEMQVAVAQAAHEMQHVHVKRVPRSQRLARQAEELGDSGKFFVDIALCAFLNMSFISSCGCTNRFPE